MKALIVDSMYYGDKCITAGLVFSDWTGSEYTNLRRCETNTPESYIPGNFWLRELPGIINFLNGLDEDIRKDLDYILVDGYVTLSTTSGPHEGLGKHLYDYLREAGDYKKDISVIGIAKTYFGKTENNIYIPVCRGESKKPLWITSIGSIVPSQAASRIKNMSGNYRIPSLIKKVDQTSKGI